MLTVSKITFLNASCQPYELSSLNLFLFMYADDMILFSEYKERIIIQNLVMITCLYSWYITIGLWHRLINYPFTLSESFEINLKVVFFNDAFHRCSKFLFGLFRDFNKYAECQINETKYRLNNLFQNSLVRKLKRLDIWRPDI